MNRILFVLKKRSNYGVSYGLVNSCRFICDALALFGVESKIVEVIDNNCIDREVHAYKPTHVIIEALWVVPEKFPVLMRLHPQVNWIVRLHSQVPFLSNEGMAFQWLAAYDKLMEEYPRFSVAGNASKLVKELAEAMNYKLDYLPNIYLPTNIKKHKFINKNEIKVGCFGAIRPFKNHVEQALGAMIFAKRYNKQMEFHINSGNFEKNTGASVLKNLQNLFADSPHKLVEHDWLNHGDFINLIRQMDIGLQVSFTETFNIVAADFVSNYIPLVGSAEIDWMVSPYQAKPTDAFDIANTMSFAWTMAPFGGHWLNQLGLSRYNKKALNTWLRYLGI